MEISAFVGHSFNEVDKNHVDKILGFLNKIVDMNIGFTWDHAENAEAKELSEKVYSKMKNKNTFIGICSSREFVADKSDFHKIKLFRKKVMIGEKNLKEKTSDWLLQEIGFAFGRNMNIIILLEDGLRIPGGIQGNLEYISFKRNYPEKSFNKILEMLSSLLYSGRKDTKEPTTNSSPPNDHLQSIEITTDIQKVIENLTFEDYRKRLLEAIQDGNTEKEQEIYQEYINSEKENNGDDDITWKARRFFYQVKFQNINVFNNLIELMKDNPENLEIKDFVAQTFMRFEEYSKAAELYELIAVKDDKDPLFNYCKAAFNYSLARKFQLSRKCLNLAQEIYIKDNRGLSILLLANYLISKEMKDDLLTRIYLEAYLQQNPLAYDERFDLAYNYSENGFHRFSFYHYGILRDCNPSPGIWNNFGIEASYLGMKSIQIRAYKEGVSLGDTNAMSNLAKKYIHKGFVDEAKEIIEKAIETKDYNKIGVAIADIEELEQEDRKQEEIIVQEIMPPRQFFSDFAIASLENIITDLPQKWLGPKSNFQISIDEDNFFARGSYLEEKNPDYLFNPSGTAGQKEELNLIYKGKILGRGIVYKMWKYSSSSNETDAIDKTPDAEGLLIINQDKEIIKGYEFDKKESGNFFEFKVEQDEQRI